jgi:dihydroorotate dehydrogenase (fumarate)
VRLPLRWIAILRPNFSISLAASTGAQTSSDVLKLILVGADVVMTTTALLRHGPAYVGSLLEGLPAWLKDRGYASIAQMKGTLSLRNCPDPSAFERASYVNMIASAPSTLDEPSP